MAIFFNGKKKHGKGKIACIGIRIKNTFALAF